MSAVLSIKSPDAIFMLTDGAVYTPGNILLDIKRKVIVSEKTPVAIATRGNQGVGDYVSSKILKAVETWGFDIAMIWLSGELQKFADQERLTKFEVTIAGLSETRGLVHLFFRSDMSPVELVFGDTALSLATSEAGLSDMGIPFRGIGEDWEPFVRRTAIPMFEFYRRISVNGAHVVGGQVDLTIVRPTGVTVETIHRWRDRVGEKILPFANRAERRRTARMAA